MEKEQLQAEDVPVKVEEGKTKTTYTTRIEFHDKDKGKRVETSVVAPSITQSGMLSFLTDDSLINYPLAGIFRYEIKQIVIKEEPHIII